MYKILDEKILAWKALSTENSSKATFQLAKKKRREEEEDEGWRSCRTAGYVTIKAKGSPLCSQDTRIGTKELSRLRELRIQGVWAGKKRRHSGIWRA